MLLSTVLPVASQSVAASSKGAGNCQCCKVGEPLVGGWLIQARDMKKFYIGLHMNTWGIIRSAKFSHPVLAGQQFDSLVDSL